MRRGTGSMTFRKSPEPGPERPGDAVAESGRDR